MDVIANLRRRLRETNPWVIDAVLAFMLVVVALGSHLSQPSSMHDYHDPDAFSVLMMLAVSVPYFFRRHAPLVVLVISTIAETIATVAGYQTGGGATVLLVGIYTVAAYCETRDRRIGAAIVSIALVIVAAARPPYLDPLSVAFNGVLFAAAWFFGVSVRNRRLYTEQLEQRAQALERERDEEAQRAVAEERLRIAQELHDVVAHSMGVIAVQAGVGAHVIDNDPAEAKKSLEAISQTSRSTLTEIRRMLGVLREDSNAEYAPAPGLGDLDRLLRDVRGAGLPVDLRFEGVPGELPPGIDFTAYRIVQEALTNALKHAGPAHAVIVIGYEPSALSIEVADDGRGVNGRSAANGHGLVGMRERVAVYGGSFSAGPAPGGGFRVSVRLPYGDDE